MPLNASRSCGGKSPQIIFGVGPTEGFGPKWRSREACQEKPLRELYISPYRKPTQVDEANSLRCSRQLGRRNSAN